MQINRISFNNPLKEQDECIPRELLSCTMSAQVNCSIGKEINQGMMNINSTAKQRTFIHLAENIQ